MKSKSKIIWEIIAVLTMISAVIYVKLDKFTKYEKSNLPHNNRKDHDSILNSTTKVDSLLKENLEFKNYLEWSNSSLYKQLNKTLDSLKNINIVLEKKNSYTTNQKNDFVKEIKDLNSRIKLLNHQKDSIYTSENQKCKSSLDSISKLPIETIIVRDTVIIQKNRRNKKK